MLKRAVVPALAAIAVSMPATATAATAKSKHKATAHNVTLKVVTAGIQPLSLAPGTNVFAGIEDGMLGGAAVHGAVRGTLDVTIGTPNAAGDVSATFTGTISGFDPRGSFTAKLTGSGVGHSNGAVTFSGTAKVVGGTGTYKGAAGSLQFSGGDPAHTDSDGDTDLGVDTFNTTGKVKY